MKRTLFAALLVLAACDTPPEIFHPGQLVIAKVNGARGMVLGSDVIRCFDPGCKQLRFYFVRFAALQSTTDTHLIEPDGSIKQSPFSIVKMQAFEMDAAP